MLIGNDVCSCRELFKSYEMLVTTRSIVISLYRPKIQKNIYLAK